jgi:hypothetical protein
MWRRLNREDLRTSNPLLGSDERRGRLIWRVYEEYEVQRSEEGVAFIQVAGMGTPHEAAAIDAYEPITDTPHLFLEFARLVESKSTGQALTNWIQRYGVPGFSYEGIWGGGDALQQSVPYPYHNDKGGTLDSFEHIWDIAWEANHALLLYEAAISGSRPKLEQVLKYVLSSDREDDGETRQRSKTQTESEDDGRLDGLVSVALSQMIEYASGALTSYCYPVISYPDCPEGELRLLAPDKLSRGWGARNLLGAMGLQFYWLITSGGELDRCKYCGRIISHTPSVPGSRPVAGRKTRSDKVFCDSRCRQNYHYHNRIKPHRPSGSS